MKILKDKKNYILIFIIFILFTIMIYQYFKVNALSYLTGIDNFPNTYQPYLKEILKKHSNWKFTALYTDLDWNYVIEQENIYGKNLVPKNYSDSWKNTKPGEYNVEIDAGWVDSSRQAVEFCMDPRNFLNEIRLFQFEELSYNSNTNNLDGIEKILYGTEFYNRKVVYLDSYGNTVSMWEKYSDLILRGGQVSKVSPYHLSSRIKQEVGPFLTHSSISGNVDGFKGLYNFYNIGATSSAEPMGAIKNGLQYAKDGKGASSEIKNKYLIPWNTKERAITGGGIFIGSSYINLNQNTIYLQKFDVIDNGNGLFWHQYMTNVLAPYSESKSIYNGYSKSGILDNSMSFVIPVYNNMPEIPTQNPNINQNDFVPDNTKLYCNASNVNIRTGPSTSYEIITTVQNQEKMTRIQKGKQKGERWDKVKLENGIIGYIYQTYVSELPNVQIEINFSNPLQEMNFEITGIDYTKNKVSYIKSLITSNLDIEIVNNKGKILGEEELVGTGGKIRLKKDNIIFREYSIILYGDINGDGQISSVDLLVLQRHILEIERLDDIFKKAGNIKKDGRNPTSVDLLLIQRHILGLSNIDQTRLKKEDAKILENTNLETLAIENILLYPPFDTNITEYNVEIPKNLTKLNLLAIPEDEKANVEVEGKDNLKQGNNKIIVTVTARDGVTKKEYTINAHK